MPELQFKGKEFVYNHHLTVPYRPLVPDANKSIGEPSLNGNLIIHGDNLYALKALLPMYAGKVDCIFIDPPYNTGNESWNYNDNVNSPMMKEWLRSNPINAEDMLRHDKWCAMMWPRLTLLRELLSDYGTLWMTLDANEIHRAASLLEEIFGEDNLLSVITTEANPRGRQSDTFFATVNDYLVCVAKDKSEVKLSGIRASEDYIAEFNKQDSDGKSWRELGLRQRGADSLRQDREDMFFSIYVDPTTGSISLHPGKPFTEKVEPKKSDGREGRWSWSPRQVEAESYRVYGRLVRGKGGIKRYDIFYKDPLERNGSERRRKPRTIWGSDVANNETGGVELKQIMGRKAFDYPKPTTLINRILEISTHQNSLILDSFAGSGTTGHSVLEANSQDNGHRRFILIEGEWSARHFLYQLRSDKTGTRGAVYEARDEAYGGADSESAAAG